MNREIKKVVTQVGKDISKHKKKVMGDWAHTIEVSELKVSKEREKELKDFITGVKYDNGKPQWSLLPAEALEEVVKVYTFGAKKYAPNNWRKGMLWSRTFSAIMRHCWAYWGGETNDPETGLNHMAHAAFGCLTLIEYTKKNTPQDDRIS